MKVHFRTGDLLQSSVSGLQAFWPGTLVEAGDVQGALDSYRKYHCAVRAFGFVPEELDHRSETLTVPTYLLRPEFVESTFHLHQATRHPAFLRAGAQVLQQLNKTRVACGYASVKHVLTMELQVLHSLSRCANKADACIAGVG